MLTTYNDHQTPYPLRRTHVTSCLGPFLQVPFGFRFEWELRRNLLSAFDFSVVLLGISAPALNVDREHTRFLDNGSLQNGNTTLPRILSLFASVSTKQPNSINVIQCNRVMQPCSCPLDPYGKM